VMRIEVARPYRWNHLAAGGSPRPPRAAGLNGRCGMEDLALWHAVVVVLSILGRDLALTVVGVLAVLAEVVFVEQELIDGARLVGEGERVERHRCDGFEGHGVLY